MGSGCLDLVFFDPILLDKSIFSSDVWLYYIYIKYLYYINKQYMFCFIYYIILYYIVLYCIILYYIYISTPEVSKLVLKFVERIFIFPRFWHKHGFSNGYFSNKTKRVRIHGLECVII